MIRYHVSSRRHSIDRVPQMTRDIFTVGAALARLVLVARGARRRAVGPAAVAWMARAIAHDDVSFDAASVGSQTEDPADLQVERDDLSRGLCF